MPRPTSKLRSTAAPDVDAAIVDAGATFCDLALHDGGFFFCADFDDVSPTHGFTEIVTDGGSLVFGASDASAPNLFESTLTSSNNDSSQNALLTLPFDFPDSGDAGISYLSIALDLRVNSILIDGSAPQVPSANAFVMFLEPHYAIYLPIVGRANVAPVSVFGTVDFNDAAVALTNIGDGGTPVGEWNRIRLQVEVGTDGGASTLSVFVNAVLVASQPVSLSAGRGHVASHAADLGTWRQRSLHDAIRLRQRRHSQRQILGRSVRMRFKVLFTAFCDLLHDGLCVRSARGGAHASRCAASDDDVGGSRIPTARCRLSRRPEA